MWDNDLSKDTQAGSAKIVGCFDDLIVDDSTSTIEPVVSDGGEYA